jgi:hypothetical protein
MIFREIHLELKLMGHIKLTSKPDRQLEDPGPNTGHAV